MAKAGQPATARVARQSVEDEWQSALKWLKGHSTRAIRDGMARYAIPSDHALSVAMRDIKALGKMLGRSNELALALWAYESWSNEAVKTLSSGTTHER